MLGIQQGVRAWALSDFIDLLYNPGTALCQNFFLIKIQNVLLVESSLTEKFWSHHCPPALLT